MNTAFKSVLLAALSGGAFVACSKPDSPSTNAAPPATSALPDLAKPETWERKDRPFRAQGRVRIGMRPNGAMQEKMCQREAGCKCLLGFELGVQGPHESNWAWLQDSGGDIGAVNGCTGEGKYPQGEAEVEGTLQEGVFVLSKPPKYLNAPTTPTSSGSAP